MKDTRSLFANLCARKETSWDSLSPETIDDERMKMLLKLPRKQVAWDTSPMDDIFYKGAGDPEKDKPGREKRVPLEWVVERMGDEEDQLQYFYVNNEGYAYARYTFRFEPRVIK